MKKIIASIIVGTSLLLSSHANADLFTTSFTSDNKGTDFSYSVTNNGVKTTTPIDTSAVAGINEWQHKSDLSLNIASGSAYEFVWSIVNYGQFGGHNPVAFLAEFAFMGHTYLTNNSQWEVKSAGTGDQWVSASLNTTGGTSAANGGDNIWTNVRPGPVAGISDGAQWLWDGAANGVDDTMSFRIVLNDKGAVEASSPGIFALFGAGLLFLAFRTRRAKI